MGPAGHLGAVERMPEEDPVLIIDTENDEYMKAYQQAMNS